MYCNAIVTMLLRLLVGRSRCTLFAINNVSVMKQCPCKQIKRSAVTVTLFRGLQTENGVAGRRCRHVCVSMYSVRAQSTLINSTFTVSALPCCIQRVQLYHTSLVSLLANKFDGTKAGEGNDAAPPSSGKLNDSVISEAIDSDPEIASTLHDMNTDFRAALAVNEIELEEQIHSHSESEMLGKEDNEESLSKNLCKEESEPIDIDKELLKYDYEEFDDVYFEPEVEEPEEPKYPISLERGECGVFDASELVTVLREENGRDICVVAVPNVMNYVDHLVLVTGRSTRHLRALAEYVRWLYKRKRGRHDPLTCKIEGIDACKDWYAIDLGNIAVHFFLKATRETYDLETLWTVGREYDDKISEATADPFATLFTHEDFLAKFSNLEKKEQQEDPPRVNKVGHNVDMPVREETIKETVYEGMENIAGWHDIVSKDRAEGNKS